MRLIKSIIIIGIIITILLLITFKLLNVYTNKNELVLVPDLIGKKINELSDIPSKDLNYKVSDSLYVKSKERGIILNQNPKPKTKVKPGRTIYLTLNKTKPILIPVPDLMDESLKMAQDKLIHAGFEVGRIDTVDSEFPIILEVSHEGDIISKGQKLLEGSKIDLKVGKGNQIVSE